MENIPPEDIDALVRENVGGVPAPPRDLRDRVWRTIRSMEGEDTFADWIQRELRTSLSPAGVVASYSLVAVLFSGLIGVWLGYAALPDRRPPDLFSSLKSTPSLTMYD